MFSYCLNLHVTLVVDVMTLAKKSKCLLEGFANGQYLWMERGVVLYGKCRNR